jgi:hypothetical protein
MMNGIRKNRDAGWIVLLMLLSVGLPSDAQVTNAASSSDYTAFRIINERNIFNPRRSASYVPSQRPYQRATRRRESFALVGTMNYDEKGPLAFFEGSSSDYRKVLKLNDKIAGFSVAAIEASRVKLATATNQVELPVGMQLTHDENRGWQVSERAETIAPRPSSSSSYSMSSSSRYSPGRTNVVPGLSPADSNNIQVADGPPLNEGSTPPEFPELQDAATPEPASPPAGGESDVAERLRRRAAAERGESTQ